MRLAAFMGVICGVGFSSCAVIPGEADIREEVRKEGPRHFYREGRDVDLSGSHLLGVPKLNPVWWLTNADRPYDPWWKPDSPEWWRKCSFAIRNPGHNLTHYVIGVADRDAHQVGTAAGHVWNPEGGWNFAVTHAGPLIHLPFVSRRGKYVECYAGWRQAGNFGLALRRAKPPEE